MPMDPIKAVLPYKRYGNHVSVIDTNDNSNYLNNDNNVKKNNADKYKLDKTKFTPNTEATQLAEEISQSLLDPHYPAILSVINKIGCTEARRLLKSVLLDIKEKKETQTPVRKPGAYFMWKYKNKMY